jgi:stage II sporulation protein D
VTVRGALLLVALSLSCATPRAPAEPAAPPAAAAPVELAPAAIEPAPAVTAAIEPAPAAPASAEPPPPASGTPAAASQPSWATDLPPPLPAPEPPPEPEPVEAILPAVVANADLMDLLWSHRLDFGEGNVPLVTIRIMEGQGEVSFRPRGRGKVALRGGEPVPVEPGAALRVRIEDGHPAAYVHQMLLSEAPADETSQLAAARATWQERGLTVRSRFVGGTYGIGGRIVDNRREILFADGDGTLASARARVEAFQRQFGVRLAVDQRLAARPSGRLVLLDGKGRKLGEADSALALDVEAGGFVVEGVVHDLRETGRERETRSYGGRLIVTVDGAGKLAVVHAVPLEELLRGLVPAEMPALSHPEALKAQSVTARSNVLAQIGVRHLGDPYMLCAEVHCQAYKGEGSHHPRTDEAIRATAGEAIFGARDRKLVDAVYHAMCGGHGEDNDVVWGNHPDPALRGRPDLAPEAATAWAAGLSEEERLRAFLSSDVEGWCRRPAATRKDRWRWERRLGPADLAAVGAALGVGPAVSLEVRGRGVSGRARSLHVVGAAGSADVTGELAIRRLLKNLPSAMAVLDRDGDGWIVRGGGWGHGVGMCQWGAVGRAEAGQGYRDILRAYYAGAEVAKVY